MFSVAHTNTRRDRHRWFYNLSPVMLQKWDR